MKFLNGKSVLITGGTKGLGKAIGLAFAQAGAQVFLTHKWGTVDESELSKEFEKLQVAKPNIIQADVGDSDDLETLIHEIKQQTDTLDIVISNVAFSKIINNITDLKRQTLELSLKYSAWPIVDLIQTIHAIMKSYPRYILAISSDGPDICHSGYDMAGASKAVLETICRYLALRLKQYGVRVNALRPGFLDTASSRATFGDEIFEKIITHGIHDIFLSPDKIANACVAFCSGLMDSVTGQVLTIDEGWSLVSPIALVTGKGLPGAFPD